MGQLSVTTSYIADETKVSRRIPDALASGKKTLTSSKSYQKLVDDITTIYTSARTALVEAYWKIGERIVRVEQQGEIKAAYGKELIPKLSKELTEKLGPGFSESQLQYMRRFYLINQKSLPAGELGWTSHAELLSIRDERKRKMLERQAIDQGLKRNELRALIRHELVREQVALLASPQSRVPSPELLPVPELGPFFTYKIIKPEIVHSFSQELLIDLGFSTVLELDRVSAKKFPPGSIVTSIKEDKGSYTLNAIRSTVRPRDLTSGTDPRSSDRGLPIDSQLYTYQAFVERVIDGDTLKVEIDLGFNIRIRQTIRLKGIDCPEMDCAEGKRAKRFVETALEGVEYLTIRTTKSDKYDRYLSEVFFASPIVKARTNPPSTVADVPLKFLNNELLTSRNAVRVRD